MSLVEGIAANKAPHVELVGYREIIDLAGQKRRAMAKYDDDPDVASQQSPLPPTRISAPSPPPTRRALGGRRATDGVRPPPHGDDDGVPLSFARTLGDEMVLQAAPKPAILWGPLGDSASSVTVSWHSDAAPSSDAAPVSARTLEWLGLKIWQAKLPPIPASFDKYIITATPDQGPSASIANVSFGEVWLCGGQSNVRLPSNMLSRFLLRVVRVLTTRSVFIRWATLSRSTLTASTRHGIWTARQTAQRRCTARAEGGHACGMRGERLPT